MKATLTFNLDDPDDKMSHMRAVKSLDLALALWQLYHNSKVIDKFQMVTPEMYDVDEKWIETIQDVLTEHGINIDELVN